jgi:hypothetical protein
LTVIVLPSCAVPDGSGCFVLDGTLPGATTLAVASESAWLVPSAFVPVTATRIVLPTSPDDAT